MNNTKPNFISKILDGYGKLLDTLSTSSMILAFLISGMVFSDVILRYVFDAPINGAYELTQLSMVFIVACGLGYTEKCKAHISVDVVTEKLKEPAKILLENACNIVSIPLYCVVCWCTIKYALSTFGNNARLPGLQWPIWIFATIISIGFILYWIMLIQRFASNIKNGMSLEISKKGWIVSAIGAVAVIAIAIIWTYTDIISVSASTVGIIALSASLIIFMSGADVGSILFLVSISSMIKLKGATAAISTVGGVIFTNANSYNWIIICFFILMGYFVFYSDLGTAAFDCAYKFFGHLNGGLALASITASTAMAACVGDTISSVVTMGSVAMPSMKKYKYSKKLTIGSVLTGATLGPLIPPSLTFITYGLVTSTSVGDLLISGVIPGIILALSYLVYVYVLCKINPDNGPKGERFTTREKLVSLKAGGPIVVIFVIVIGGIYAGVFTPTEGGAFGAFATFILTLAMRRMTRKRLMASLKDTGRLVGGLMLVVLSSLVFGSLMVWAKIPFLLEDFFDAVHLGPTAVVIIMIVVYFILGLFMDPIVTIMVAVPIFYPVVKKMGVDPIYFGVITTMMCNLGNITPPFGIALFALKAQQKELSFNDIASASWPFVIISLVVVALIVIFPEIAIWLPYALK